MTLPALVGLARVVAGRELGELTDCGHDTLRRELAQLDDGDLVELLHRVEVLL